MVKTFFKAVVAGIVIGCALKVVKDMVRGEGIFRTC